MSTTFPTSLDTPLDVTDEDYASASQINTVDERARAVAAKVGADGSTVPTSLDYRLRHLVDASAMTTAAGFETVWRITLAEGSAAMMRFDVVAVREGANEALGHTVAATYRSKGGAAELVGTPLVSVDQREGLASAEVILEATDTTVALRVKSNLSARVHWTVRGVCLVARPGGM